jgi:hypothetical protein
LVAEVLKVPAVTVIPSIAVVVSALLNVQAPPAPLNVKGAANETPFVVRVFPVVVALNVIRPVAVHNVPANSVIEPLTARVPVLENVTVPADTVKSRHSNAPVNVTVYVPA